MPKGSCFSLSITAVFLFGLVAPASAFKIGVADNDVEDSKSIATIELIEGQALSKKLLRYRMKQPAPCPRAEMKGELKAAAIVEAKQLLKELKEQREKLNAKPHKDKTVQDHQLAGYNWQAVSQVSTVVATLGNEEDVKWLSELFDDSFVVSALAAYHFRNKTPFADLKLTGDKGWNLANKLAEAGNRAAIDYLVKEEKASEKKKPEHIMHLLVKYRHPEADAYAKACIAAYQKMLADGTHPSRGGFTASGALWGILHLLKDPEKNQEYLSSIDGIVFGEVSLTSAVVIMAMKDPRIIFDVMIGSKGKIPDWRKNQVARCRWHTYQLYAACAGRSAADINTIVDHYRSLVVPMAMEVRMVNGGERATSIISGHILSNIMSAIRLSPKAADLCQAYADSERTSFRYYDTPWIKMAWMPETVFRDTGKRAQVGSSTAGYTRLAPFSHEELLEVAKKHTDGDPLSKRALLLWHRCINASFLPPELSMLGDRRVGVVRMTGDQSMTAVHTRIQVITTQGQGKLNVGFKLGSLHHDGGGLASAIRQNHLLLQPLHDDHHRAQLDKVRLETKDGKIHELEFSKTTDSGIHLFSVASPAVGLEGAYLRYDWKLLGDDRYPIVHALYDPWFALVR